ncbi:patatin-like phospholipase family protein [Herbaspirillum sp. LeCh32-8]|uniref:patatin-like phospholipase family protein n=1 Tax=Herbaspirillum sp. LeCh32-8 TaxID=2821356 RepID=UPI001AE66079|nr:patatin-like phospholipase family protein [Herbaspirillum sp. LeCh32-8]MBP0599775.1 patatin-like phospholipase family protein [Herbaspirillum sp. LeCh32-8]
MRISSLRRTACAAIVSTFVLAGCGTTTWLQGSSDGKPADSVSTTPAPVASTPKKVRIGLALGGGAARGFAHIGVIKALESQGIDADIVAGTSAGSLVGAMYAAGNDGFALQKLALAMDEATISDWSVPFFAKVAGVLKGEGVQNYVNKTLNNLPIEKFKIPFGAVATDLKTGQPILFQRGNPGIAVRASSAVPGVFQSVKIGDHYYVDGGLVAPVPVRFARQMGADFVIAVNISAQPEAQASSSSVDVLLQTFAIMGQTINQYELKNADIVLQPVLGAMKGSDFASRNVAILAGEQAAMAAMPEIKRKLKAMAGN